MSCKSRATINADAGRGNTAPVLTVECTITVPNHEVHGCKIANSSPKISVLWKDDEK